MSEAKPKILCVDDEPSLLDGLKRCLRQYFEVQTAEGGAAGLRAIENGDPFAVVVSDLRMPGMNGIEFLSRARECAPDTTRVLLTGSADFNAAIAAVNEGNIFRFLSKPCPSKTLIASIKAAAEQHRLVTAEGTLLQELERLSRTDGLTGLLNRRAIMENLLRECERAKRYGKPWCFLMLDLDYFKRVNDERGHVTGDHVLEKAAEAMCKLTRSTDFVGRFGGDEFCIVMVEADRNAAALVAQRLCELVGAQEHSDQTGNPFSVTCSIGIAQWRPGVEPEQLIEQADQALYSAKSAGRNCVRGWSAPGDPLLSHS